jgi:hypothetical protein
MAPKPMMGVKILKRANQPKACSHEIQGPNAVRQCGTLKYFQKQISVRMTLDRQRRCATGASSAAAAESIPNTA